MTYPQIVEYNEAIQHPAQAFTDPELKQGTVKENTLGLPLALSGGFALTYTVTTPRRKCAVRCFHREIPALEQKYSAIAGKLKSAANGYFVDFDFQRAGIKIRQNAYPIVRMDWIEGDPLGVWLDKNIGNNQVENLRKQFFDLAGYLERLGIAHGDIQNGNVILGGSKLYLIDYDGMYVPGMKTGAGSETGHKHFQHPDRGPDDFGPTMDRFSFIVVDLSLRAVAGEPPLYRKFREGGETIIFKANDFADPSQSEIFRLLENRTDLKKDITNFAAICAAPIERVPSLEDFLAGKNIPAAPPIVIASKPKPSAQPAAYISAFAVIDARDFETALRHVGDRVELVGQIVELKDGVGQRGRGRGKPYVFVNFSHWKGSAVKLSIWSEGLQQLREKPSPSWVGRWVSVTGLVDAPYTSRRYHYTHVGITVEQEGQINQITETEALYRLKSLGKAQQPRNRRILEDIIPVASGANRKAGATPIIIPSARPKAVSRPLTGNQAIAQRFSPAPASSPNSGSQPAYSVPTKSKHSTGIPGWVWVVLGIIVLIILANH